MEPSDELVALPREIRDQQRELGVFLQAWKEESDRKYQDWRGRDDERYEASQKENRERKEENARNREVAKAQQAQWAASNSRWDELTDTQLKSYKRYERLRPYLIAFFLLILVTFVVGVWINPGGGKSASSDQPGVPRR